MDHRPVANGAAGRHVELRVVLPLLARLGLDTHDLGDDVSGALDDHAVPLAHVESSHLVEVVQGRSFDGGAADEDRRERRYGSERAHPTDVDEDVFYRRRRLLRRKFEGRRPARVPRDVAEALLVCDLVDLYDDAVRPVLQAVALLFAFGDELDHLVERFGGTPVRVHPEAEPIELF